MGCACLRKLFARRRCLSNCCDNVTVCIENVYEKLLQKISIMRNVTSHFRASTYLFLGSMLYYTSFNVGIARCQQCQM